MFLGGVRIQEPVGESGNLALKCRPAASNRSQPRQN